MKIVILIYQIIQEKFAYGELFMLVMIAYIFMFKMVKKMQNSGLEMVAGLTRPLKGETLTGRVFSRSLPLTPKPIIFKLKANSNNWFLVCKTN